MSGISTTGISGIGIPAISAKTGTTQRSRAHDPRDGDDGDNNRHADADAEPAAPTQPPPGVGHLVDKVI